MYRCIGIYMTQCTFCHSCVILFVPGQTIVFALIVTNICGGEFVPLYLGIYQEVAPETVYPTSFRPAATTADLLASRCRGEDRPITGEVIRSRPIRGKDQEIWTNEKKKQDWMKKNTFSVFEILGKFHSHNQHRNSF